MFTKKEIELAPAVYEAIKRISVKSEKYPCLTKDKNGIEQLTYKKWEWEPKPFELFLSDKDIYCVVDVSLFRDPQIDWIIEKAFDKDGNNDGPFYPEHCIPILHWEKIEEILEGMGYWLRIGDKYSCQIHLPNGVNAWPDGAGIGKSRQEAVQKAVIKLGEGVR